jgi:hypothetical protein
VNVNNNVTYDNRQGSYDTINAEDGASVDVNTQVGDNIGQNTNVIGAINNSNTSGCTRNPNPIFAIIDIVAFNRHASGLIVDCVAMNTSLATRNAVSNNYAIGNCLRENASVKT